MTKRLLTRINLPALAMVAALLLGWQVAVATKVVNFSYLPLPTQIFTALRGLLTSGDFYGSLGYTLGLAVIAAVLSAVIALPLGILLASSALTRSFCMATLDVLRHIPLIALMPVALLVWGPSTQAEIILATFAALWPILLNVMGGVVGLPPRMLEVARVFRLSRLDTVRKIVMPATLTATVVGLRLAIVAAFLVTIVSEMLVSGKGLGWDLIVAQGALNPSKLWALAFVAGLIGYLLNVVLERALGKAWPYYTIVNGNEA